MHELTEFEKTLTELYRTNGHSGLHRYFVHNGMTDDEAEAHIDNDLYIYDIRGSLFVTETPIDNVPTTRYIVDTVSTTEASSLTPHTVTVTFADGSTKEVDVLPDGTVLNPVIPTFIDPMGNDGTIMPEGLNEPLPGESKRSFTARLKAYYKTIGLPDLKPTFHKK